MMHLGAHAHCILILGLPRLLRQVERDGLPAQARSPRGHTTRSRSPMTSSVRRTATHPSRTSSLRSPSRRSLAALLEFQSRSAVVLPVLPRFRLRTVLHPYPRPCPRLHLRWKQKPLAQWEKDDFPVISMLHAWQRWPKFKLALHRGGKFKLALHRGGRRAG